MEGQPAADVLPGSTTNVHTKPGPSVSAGDAATASVTWLRSPRNFYLTLTIVAVGLGALSLLFPSTPSYDPWSWLLWGRQIIHGQLTITTSGTSWKPLPMIFTVPFALFGSAAPNLWLVIARAGVIAAVVMVFRLAWRLARVVPGLFGDPAELGRTVIVGPAILAGGIAAVALALSASGGFLSSNVLGYSEALATALVLIAVDRHLDGKPRQAFAVGFFVALDRPETWLFWGPYGLWLMWKDRRTWPWVVGSGILVLLLWFVPVKLGCGQFNCSVSRALHPRSNSIAYAKFPFWAELKEAAWPTILLRLKFVAAIVVVAVGVISWRTWRRDGIAGLQTDASRARIATAVLGLAGLAWFVVIALMTQIGFSGNNRYLVLGSALVDICGAVGFGWAAAELAMIVGRRRRRHTDAAEAPSETEPGAGSGRGRLSAALGWATAGLLALVFMLLPNWVGSNMISIPRTHGSLVYQANLRKGLGQLVALYGGADKVLSCGTVMTEGFQVPMVAWTLNVATPRIEAPPANPDEAGPAPNVILQTRDTRSSSLLPVLESWPGVHYHYVGTRGPVHMFTNCTS